MPTVTVLADDAYAVDARVQGGGVHVDGADLHAATGWELKPEGLCRGEVCVPVSDPERLVDGNLVDVAALGEAVGAPVVVDADERIVAIGERPDDLGARLLSLDAPDVTLPDLGDHPTALSAFGGRKRLLVAFASW